MSKFPIANLLKSGVPVHPMEGYGKTMANHYAVSENLIKSAVFFDVSNAAELYWCGRKNYYRLDSDFGPMRPPYPLMWMEWAIPDEVMIDGHWHRRGIVSHHGSLVFSRETTWSGLAETTGGAKAVNIGKGAFDQDGNYALAHSGRLVDPRQEAVQVMALHYVLSDDAKTPIFIPYGREIGLDPDGTFNGWCLDISPKEDVDEKKDAIAKEVADLNTVWMSLNLINCRNVTTRQAGSVFTRSGREKRQGVPVTRYHTIMLPGMSSSAHGRHSAKDKAMMAQHRVRGHFKTFTEDAPLFGKRTGVFWWGWQIRGDVQHGMVVSDYEVRA